MKIETVILRAAARCMGRRGGVAKTDKKIEALRKNAQKAGRKRTYHYEMKAQAVLGKKHEMICAIPDEVFEDPKKYRIKTFAVYCGAKRLNARVWSFAGDKTNIRVRRV